MSQLLLTTKLVMPRLRPEQVARPRLVEQLNAGLERRLILISAPAGFGKTTLLSEWARHCGRAMAWLTVDEGDNDAARFLAYLLAAFHAVDTALGAAVGELPISPRAFSAEGVLTSLTNQISASPADFVLVLDDYHLITAEPVQAGLAFLLDHQPDNLHIALATRADPPLPLARLRARGQLTELRQADLRFTAAEAEEFLRQLTGQPLAAETAAALNGRTEGWAAGLQMAALALPAGASPQALAQFVQAFSGSHRFILDYLLEEVLQHQPPETQTFLLQTSILERMCEPLCAWVLTGAAPPAEAQPPAGLERLERANLFIVPLDSERRWYRYHRLFSDLLRQRLQETRPAGVPELHRRASQWFEQAGLLPEAIAHAFAAADWEHAADLVERAAETTLLHSETVTLLSWTGRLPLALLQARPLVYAYHALALLLSGQRMAEVDAALQDLRRGPGAQLGQVIALQALWLTWGGQLAEVSQLAQQAFERLPENEVLFRALASWLTSSAALAEASIPVRRKTLEQLLERNQSTGHLMQSLLLSRLGETLTMQGQLTEARAVYARALASAEEAPGQYLPVASEAFIGLGQIYREWHELENAARYLRDGIDYAYRWQRPAAIDAYLQLALLYHYQSDRAGADECLATAAQLAREFDVTEADDFLVAMHTAWLHLQRGDVPAAQAWAAGRGLAVEPVASLLVMDQLNYTDQHLRKYECLVLVRLWLAQKQPQKVLDLLKELLPPMEHQGRVKLVIEIEMLRALAYQALGNLPAAQVHLARALTLAEPGGFVRLFVDEGGPLRVLLEQRLADGSGSRSYLKKLLAAFTGPAGPPPPSTQLPGEPLSARELEILRLIAAGLSNQEIAHKLHLSLPTIKWHTSHLYGKLEVTHRTQAVAQARALGLLSDR